MNRSWCVQCGSQIESIIHNSELPLDTFHLDFKQELEENDIYCSYCARNIDISSEWGITTNIRIAHGSFSDRIYFSPEIINYSPIEFEVRPIDSVSKIHLELFENKDMVFEYTIKGKDDESTAYIPPFSKNAIDFNWTYSEQGQDGVIDPKISEKYTGGKINARATFIGSLYPDKLTWNSQFSKEFKDIQTMIVENNI